MAEAPRIALKRSEEHVFEVSTDESHPFEVVRPFTVQVFDAMGLPVPQHLVYLTPPGLERTGRMTDADGIARLERCVLNGDVTVEVDDLEPIDESPTRPVEVDGADPYDGEPIDLPGSRPAKIQLPPRVRRVRLVGLLFDTDKTFLLPEAIPGMRRLAHHYEEAPTLAVLVVGHADRTGDAAYNESLSQQRAIAVAAFLRDDVDDWLSRYGSAPAGQPWGVPEDKHMLGHLTDETGTPFYDGPIDAIDWDANTKAAVSRFQTHANTHDDAGLDVDGVLGPNTRRALVTRYMRQDGTTLPEDATIETHGCGEAHPVEPTADGVASEANRRTEVFLFEHVIEPSVPGSCGGCSEYPQWVARTTSTVDVRGGEPRIVASEWDI